MYNHIKEIYQNNYFVSFYDDISNEEKHYTGKINAFDKDLVLISHINSRGEYDGYILKRIQDIFKISFNGKYEDKIKNLYEHKKQSHTLSLENCKNIVKALFQYAISNKKIVRFETENSIVIGYVKKFDNDVAMILQLNDYAEKSSETCLNIDMFDTISVDTDYEQDLDILYSLSQMDSSSVSKQNPTH